MFVRPLSSIRKNPTQDRRRLVPAVPRRPCTREPESLPPIFGAVEVPSQTHPPWPAERLIQCMIEKTEEQWRAEFGPERYHVLREGGTEAPNSGSLLRVDDQAPIPVARAARPLFTSDSKFDSHCGWPSFTHPEELENVRLLARQQLRDAPDGSALQSMRLAPRTRFRRWSGAARDALLH